MAQNVCGEKICSKICGQNEGKLLRNEKELNVTDKKRQHAEFVLLYFPLRFYQHNFIINRILK